MKKLAKSVLGVTLLEIMLVLAIAAMVIVMSVRYYQSANASQQANNALNMIQGISAAADSLAQGSGSYVTGGVSTATVQRLMPSNTLTSPWGSAITVTAGSATQYTVTIPSTPPNVCPLIVSRLGASPKFTAVTACSATATTNISYTYDSTL